MSAGTKIFLAVVVLFVGSLVVYYGVLSPSPESAIQKDSAGENDGAETFRNALPDDSTGPLTDSPTQRRVGPPERSAQSPETVQRNLARPEDQRSGDAALPPFGTTTGPLLSDGGKELPGAAATGTRRTAQDTSHGNDQQTQQADAATTNRNGESTTALTRTATVDDETDGDAESQEDEPKKRIAYYRYTVRSGDTLAWIAEDWFGEANKWHLITAMNPGLDPDRLRVGQTIKLPPKEATRASVTGSTEDTRGNTYTVKPGDTLSVIAGKVYGKASAWERIYDANRAVIGSDPHTLEVGMTLTIPNR